MVIKKLYLQDFRQFGNTTFDFDPQLTLILAANGAGKTTILEALNLLASGKSFRAGKTAELLRFGQEIARAYVLLNDDLRLGVALTAGSVGGQKTAIKSFSLGKTKKRVHDFVGNLLTVCFRPEDLLLIEGSASRRRDYLDNPLTLTSAVYRQAIKNYHAALVRRNKTLLAIREGELTIDNLSYWNNICCQTATTISTLRQKYLNFVNAYTGPLRQFSLTYDHSLITNDRLSKYQAAEIAVGHSLIGPHKDDLTIYSDFMGKHQSLMTYGSRGQHRLAVLWLKMAELAYLQQTTKQQPVLLLDDICSELDQAAKDLVKKLATVGQTIITTTEESVIKLWSKQTLVIRL
jgi:DNA replication and repair protein RecF